MGRQAQFRMEIRVSKTPKFFLWLIAVFFTFGQVTTSFAQPPVVPSLCTPQGIVFGFFNGVRTTESQAKVGLFAFEEIHGSIAPSGEGIRYELFYNYSNGFEDFVETFAQRLQEQESLLDGRFELFFESLNGGGPWWSKIVQAIPNSLTIVTGISDAFKSFIVAKLTGLISNPPTEFNYVDQQARIDNFATEGKKLLFVAHSQGNLFVNKAYDYAQAKVGAGAVNVVHIAPASPIVPGSHTLADLDLVINGLRIIGSVVSITDTIPGYLLRPPGLNKQKDIMGHGLLEIYLNPLLTTSTHVKNDITAAIASLKPSTFTSQAKSGFFSATLIWDGLGDVDLHVYEPNAKHVYWATSVGTAGYLDIDNTRSFGPEHYYASCDPNQLLTGSYIVAIANYSSAESRNATVQISTSASGVLGTKSVTLGPATRSTPVYTLFNVVVSKDSQTGKYSVSTSL